MRDGVLFRKYRKRNDTGQHFQFIVPKVMREEIMQQMHASRWQHILERKRQPADCCSAITGLSCELTLTCLSNGVTTVLGTKPPRRLHGHHLGT